MENKFINKIESRKVFKLKGLMDYVDGGVESRALVQRDNCSLTLFSFDKGEGVTPYRMPGETMLYVCDGVVEVTISKDKKSILKEGNTIVVPAGVSHGYDALEKSKMMVIIVK